VATTLIAIGKLRGPEADLVAEYLKRLGKAVVLREFESPRGQTGVKLQQLEGEKLLSALPDNAFLVALDEAGQDLSSVELAKKLTAWEQRKNLAFVIGGADGLAPAVRARADFTLALGRKTWPHLLCRVLLLEQIYRARQINAGHPYHRV
jgi:23S rRNA (pseudouridine1915-N3)-methyltransferase